MMTVATPEKPDRWGNLLKVPDLVLADAKDDQEALQQMAEYIVSAVELSTKADGKLVQNGKDMIIQDIVLNVLNVVYKAGG